MIVKSAVPSNGGKYDFKSPIDNVFAAKSSSVPGTGMIGINSDISTTLLLSLLFVFPLSAVVVVLESLPSLRSSSFSDPSICSFEGKKHN